MTAHTGCAPLGAEMARPRPSFRKAPLGPTPPFFEGPTACTVRSVPTLLARRPLTRLPKGARVAITSARERSTNDPGAAPASLTPPGAMRSGQVAAGDRLALTKIRVRGQRPGARGFTAPPSTRAFHPAWQEGHASPASLMDSRPRASSRPMDASRRPTCHRAPRPGRSLRGSLRPGAYLLADPAKARA